MKNSKINKIIIYYWLIFLLLFISINSKSQAYTDTLFHKSSLRLNLLGLPVKSLTLFIDQEIKPKNFIEISAGYMFSNISRGNKYLFFSDNDPFWYYSRVKTGLGFNHYFSNTFYIGSLIQYKYSYFNKTLFKKYINFEGEAADEDWEISRKKYETGVYIKMGFTKVLVKHFIFDIYLGIGERRVRMIENLWSCYGFYGIKENNYPIITKDLKYSPDIFIGFSVGVCK